MLPHCAGDEKQSGCGWVAEKTSGSSGPRPLALVSPLFTTTVHVAPLTEAPSSPIESRFSEVNKSPKLWIWGAGFELRRLKALQVHTSRWRVCRKQCLKPKRCVHKIFSALKLWLICNYVLYCIQIWNQCSKWGKAMWIELKKVGLWGQKRKMLCPILTENKSLLCNAICLEMGPKSHLFTCLICNHVHLTEYSNRKDSLLNYWQMAICWVYELLLVNRILKRCKSKHYE